jgi:HSP20 family molecular chaperone IbpA
MPEKTTAVQMAPERSTLKLVEPRTLLERMNRMHENIARRAFEFFESAGSFFGHELEHWFKAEAELLHPVHISISESDESLHVQAEVPGFGVNELAVSLEPWRLTISGKKETGKESKKEKTIYKERCASELLRVVDLPVEVDPVKTTATLKNGVLELDMAKSAHAKTTRVGIKTA